jgi:serine/threonine-protein kinase
VALAPGTRLGPYEILSALGAGGMGEVYRARDAKLSRDVAIKVLPDTVAHDPDRLARFEREAKTLAALNHPNIAHIHGLEDSTGVPALVMELVEGPTLADRVARGPIPIDEALPIAKQIADALEAAHEQGIIHRDLKPANIKVRADGTVKVLDFGLAKAMEPAGAASANAMNSPTLSMHATQAGIILGTAAYMSPEQASGKPVDKRADVWSFGVVLMEMLTGHRLFDGETVSHTLADVLRGPIDFQRLPAGTPREIRDLLRRCLNRDVKKRLRDMGEARIAIEDALGGVALEETSSAALRAPAAPRSVGAHALPWVVTGVVGVALIGALVLWAPWRPAPAPAPRKLMALIGADASLSTDAGASAILSPDGTTLAFVAQQTGQTRLFVRRLDQLQAAALAGTEGAESPFFSPDGQWLAFFAGGKLKKIGVTGGAAATVCDAATGRGGTWTDDDTIIFTPSNGANVTLMRVPAAGGTPAAAATLSQGAVTQRWPQALPRGKGVLYSEHSVPLGWDRANLVVASLSGGTPKIVVRGGYYGRYVPSGHLIYMRRGTLFAARFDLNRLEVIGQAVPALEGVAANAGVTGGAQVAVSSEGTLVYVPDTATTANPINWLTRDGKTTGLRAAKADWANPQFSPDGQKLALDISDGKQRDIWVYDWARDTLTQLTFDPGEDRSPVWTPDGKRIVFASDRAKRGVPNLYWVNAEGTGEVTRLTDSPDVQLPGSWHPSGKFFAFYAIRNAPPDLMILPMEGDAARGWRPGNPTVFLGTPAVEANPTFSPDGRWIAYVSTEAGGSSIDVYVRPFPDPGGKWRVSTTGGGYPRWSTTTHELLYLNAQNKVMFAPYAVVGDSFRADTPRMWSPTGVGGAGLGNSAYDLHPDGKRLAAVAASEGGASQDKLVFVSNFFDYLRKIAPGTK